MIIVKNRELLIPETERYIGTTYDHLSENRQFKLPRVAQNGVDLSALTFRLDLKYANDTYDTVILSKEIEGEYIVLTWEILSAVQQIPGTLYIAIRATDGEATVRWASFGAAMYVERHLNTPGSYTGDLTEIEQMELDHAYFKSVIQELESHLDYAHDAEAWATGNRNGEAVPSTDETYHNNAKYYKDQAANGAGSAKNFSLDAEAWAKGTREGTAVTSGQDGYHDNAKYYSEQAAATVADTNARFDNAIAAVSSQTEVVDARVSSSGTTYTTLKNRLDTEHSGLNSDLSSLAGMVDGLRGEYDVTAGTVAALQTAVLQHNDDIAALQSTQITETASGAPATFTDGAVNVPMRSVKVALEPVQSGSGDPSPTNIRPITGYSQIVLGREGKNMLPFFTETKTSNGITVTPTEDGRYDITGTSTAYAAISYSLPGMSLSGQYRFVVSGIDETLPHPDVWLYYASKDGEEIGNIVNNGVIDLSVNNLTSIYIAVMSGRTLDCQDVGLMLIPAEETDKTFEAYSGQTWNINLGQTVYGAVVDPVNANAIVTKGQIASYNGETLPGAWISDRDVYAPGTTPTIGAQVVYDLASPETISVTRQYPTTAKGLNHVWSAGPVAVEYVADPKLYIQKMIAAAVASH